MTTGATNLQFHRIVISDRTISEVDGVALVTIPRDEVRSIRLAHGVVAERPIFLVFCGIALVAAGIAGVLWLVNGVLLRLSSFAAGGLVFGPLMIMAALRTGPVLLVETSRGVRKLGFGKSLEPRDLPQFIDDARTIGLNIDRGPA